MVTELVTFYMESALWFRMMYLHLLYYIYAQFNTVSQLIGDYYFIMWFERVYYQHRNIHTG